MEMRASRERRRPTRIARSAILVGILPAGLMQTRPPVRQSRIGAPHPTPLRAETSIAFDLRSTRCWLANLHRLRLGPLVHVARVTGMNRDRAFWTANCLAQSRRRWAGA